jgi:hypothetical protein
LKLQPARPGVWLATEHLGEYYKGKKLQEPIEVICGSLIAERVKKGLRPDGELMYRYSDRMPDGYPDEWLKYTIDIFPEKINETEGIKTGHLILHGHIIEPPYKFQVIVVSEDEVRILVNGVDIDMPNKGQAKRHERDRIMSQKRNPAGEYRKSIQNLVMSMLLLLPTETVAEMTMAILNSNPQVANVRRCTEKGVCLDTSPMMIQYSWMSENFIRSLKGESKDRAKDLIEKGPKYFIFVGDFDDHFIAHCVFGDELIRLRKKVAPPWNSLRAALQYAGREQYLLSKGHISISFGRGYGGNISRAEYDTVVSVCRNKKLNLFESLDILTKGTLIESMATRILANCGR